MNYYEQYGPTEHFPVDVRGDVVQQKIQSLCIFLYLWIINLDSDTRLWGGDQTALVDADDVLGDGLRGIDGQTRGEKIESKDGKPVRHFRGWKKRVESTMIFYWIICLNGNWVKTRNEDNEK